MFDARRGSPIDAASRLAETHGIRHGPPVILKDGSNLLVHLAPAPVVLRIATFTGRIRAEPLPYLRREVDLVSWLSRVGAAVMPPSDLLPPGPHVVDGWCMSAWGYVEHERGTSPSPMAALTALHDLHAAMRGYPGALPFLNPAADDLDRALGFAETHRLIEPMAAADLRGRRDRLIDELAAAAPDRQVLHGDAFPKNAVVTTTGIVWIDFEDCCSGPSAWDLATLVRSTRDDAVAAEVRRRIGDDALRVAFELRVLQAEVWTMLHDARLAGRVEAWP